MKGSRDRLGHALRKAHRAWGDGTLAGAVLRDPKDASFRGSLAAEIERLPEEQVWAWLSGTDEGETGALYTLVRPYMRER